MNIDTTGIGIGWGYDGTSFTPPPVPEPSHEEVIAAAEEKKQSLISEANEYMNSKQWPGQAAMGRLSDAEKEQYNAWLDYLDALEAIDTSSAPDIEWPTSPAEV